MLAQKTQEATREGVEERQLNLDLFDGIFLTDEELDGTATSPACEHIPEGGGCFLCLARNDIRVPKARLLLAACPADGPTFFLAAMATILPAVAGVCTMWQAQARLGARGLVRLLLSLVLFFLLFFVLGVAQIFPVLTCVCSPSFAVARFSTSRTSHS